MPRSWKHLTFVLAVALLPALVPATAGAATFGVSGGTLTYTASPGEANRLEIRSYSGQDPGDHHCRDCGTADISYGGAD
ncbi:MAG: hypothetical protein QOI98_1917, partial [Solirubrobacteraceae bacterium]|nr:hypothetical protein [Solirubrobacteraceae bacterium]